MLKVYTQEEFDAIKRDLYGFKRLPQGDYSRVDFRGKGFCLFGDGSIIGDDKNLGDGNMIGKWNMIGNGNTIGNRNMIGNSNKIGKWNTIGNSNKIGDGNTIGDSNKIGDRNTIGYGNTIGHLNKIGDGNTIGDSNKIGEFFTYGKNTTFEGGAVKNGRYVKVGQIGSENREAYFFIDENGKFFVRAGCWFSDMEKFIERVKGVHGGTLFEKQYLAACEYARAVLPGMLEEAKK